MLTLMVWGHAVVRADSLRLLRFTGCLHRSKPLLRFILMLVLSLIMGLWCGNGVFVSTYKPVISSDQNKGF